jgi:hypothetical protein
MKKFCYTSLIIILLLFAGQTEAQNLIAVQNGGAPTFYTKLDTAIVHASDGDTLYLSGGAYSLTCDVYSINKRIHIVGAGFRPDTSFVTSLTFIKILSQYAYPYFLVESGASGGSINGVQLDGSIEFNSSDCVTNFEIRNCLLYYIRLNNSKNNLIIGNSLSFIYGGESNYILNNIMDYHNSIKNGIIKNNIFMSSGQPILLSSFGCIFENNIFLNQSFEYDSYDNQFYNNLFIISDPFSGYSNIGFNNIFNQTNIFLNQSRPYFSFSDDYHLLSTSPGKNAGKDGTDIGIYGGQYPWKDGKPFNPHFQKAIISHNTDNNGNLNVQIKVAAQDR